MKSFRSVVVVGGAALAVTFVVTYETNIRAAVRGFSSAQSAVDVSGTLQQENEALRAELAAIAVGRAAVSGGRRFLSVRAAVFSRYPFGAAQTVVIDAGEDRGMRSGMPALTTSGALFGTVKKVRQTQSEVQSVFDPQWKISVAVGAEKTRALFVGGTAPTLELVPRRASITAGDRVIAVGEEAPYGTFIGTVVRIEESVEAGWKRAIVELPYTFDAIDALDVVTNFP